MKFSCEKRGSITIINFMLRGDVRDEYICDHPIFSTGIVTADSVTIHLTKTEH